MRHLAPALSVRSVAESLRFYTETLGFEEWFRYDVEGRWSRQVSFGAASE